MSFVDQFFVEFFYLLLWLLAIQIIALGVVPLTAVLFPKSPDRGYSFSKAFGLLLVTYLSWLIGSSGIFCLNTISVLATVATCWLISLALPRDSWGGWRQFFGKYRSQVALVEILFCSTFLALALISSFKPEIFWGEKPMDFSFLNYFTRLETLPPDDPWAAGQRMQYYYFGYLIFANIHKLTGVPAAYGYNLSVVTVTALYIITLYGLLLSVVRNKPVAFFGSLAIGILANLQGAYLALIAGKRFDFDQYFWPTTRLFTSPAFSEYPIWSFLFADLHPHFMAMPFTALLLGLCFSLLESGRRLSLGVLFNRLGLALVFGSMVALNTWDLISFGVVLALCILFRPIRFCRNESVFLVGMRVLIARIGELFLIVSLAIGLYWPFLSVTATEERLHFGWVTSTEFNSFFPLLMHWGLWLSPVLLGLIFLLCSSYLGGFKLHWKSLLAVIPVIILILLSLYHSTGISLSFFSLLVILPVLSILWLGIVSNHGSSSFIAVILTALAWLLTGAEALFLMDRANTIFKFYIAGWTLFGIVSIIVLWQGWRKWSLSQGRPAVRLSGYLVGFLAGFVFLMGLIGSLIGIYVQTNPSQAKALGPRPTLNGMAFLEASHPEDAEVINWINSNINGTPTLLEAHGPSYQLYSRICMYTGLPIVMGWDYHVSQRNPGWQGIRRRVEDVAAIYKTADVAKALELIRLYKIDLIVVGEVERRTYPKLGLSKFGARSDLFRLLFASGQSAIYAPIKEAGIG